MPSALRFETGARTDVGRVRGNNEDALAASPSVLAVSDGVGGRPAGEIASHLAVSISSAIVTAGAEPLAALRAADEVILSTAQLNPFFTNMCCTLTMVALHGSTARLVHVGDSRAYLVRGGRMTQLSKDHTLINKLVEEGTLTPEQAEADPRKNTIYQYLGRGNGALEPFRRAFRVRAGDRLLLCTDGISHFLGDAAISEITASGSAPQEVAETLCDTALDIGSNDNVTAVVADIVTA